MAQCSRLMFMRVFLIILYPYTLQLSSFHLPMNTRITHKFVMKSRPTKDGLCPIYLRAILQGKKIEIATSVMIPSGDWMEDKQRVRKRNFESEKHNMVLDAFDKKALKCILNNFVNDDQPLTLQQFRESMLSNGQADDNSFTDYLMAYLDDNKARLRPESYSSYKSQITKMLKFKNPILFSDVTERFIFEYQDYMSQKLNNNENTISKSLRSLRTFVNIAMRYGHIKANPFKYVPIKRVDGKRDFLSMEEVNVLSTCYYGSEKLSPMEREILRYFLFSCYTGLRYSDLKSLNVSAIRDGCINLKMHKTSHIVSIPLSHKATQLIPENVNDMLFRVYCNKVTNRVLKQVGAKCGIEKKLTCHVARHTFATISISIGIPIEVISKLLGHTNLRTTQVYAKIVDSVKKREMEKWNLV